MAEIMHCALGAVKRCCRCCALTCCIFCLFFSNLLSLFALFWALALASGELHIATFFRASESLA